MTPFSPSKPDTFAEPHKEPQPGRRTITIDLDTGEWLTPGVVLKVGDGPRVAASVLPGWPEEKIDQAYGVWMSSSPEVAPFTAREIAASITLVLQEDGTYTRADGGPATDREIAAHVWGGPRTTEHIRGQLMAVFTITTEVTDSHDPRHAYDLSLEGAYRSWPCECKTRLDEHADQAAQSRFPQLDIIDHVYQPALDEGSTFFLMPFIR